MSYAVKHGGARKPDYQSTHDVDKLYRRVTVGLAKESMTWHMSDLMGWIKLRVCLMFALNTECDRFTRGIGLRFSC